MRRRLGMRSMLGVGNWALGVAATLALSGAASAQMPDPSLMHGKALPAAELPVGTVTVRVVRESVANNISGQEVRVTVGGTARSATTDAQGRAEFSNLPQGADGRAEASVNGEQLVSDPFSVPTSGGLRVILVAGLKAAAARADKEAAAAAAAPAVKGTVAFGPNSRVVMEFRDDALQVFYVLDILNTTSSRVDIGGPLIMDLPTGAAGATILQGSSPAATVRGDRVTVTGPFAPGNTSVQVGFQLQYDQAHITVEQKWPAAVEQLTVGVEKVGTVGLASPQFSTVGEVRTETGTPFLLANGPPLPAGSTLTMQLTNLPVHSATPRRVALGLATTIVAIGFWLAFRRRVGSGEMRRRLVARRDQLLADLAAVERRQRRAAARDRDVNATDATRRERIMSELEQVYAELDEVGSGPQGGGKDVAA